ncbi:MAG: mechanosensitive ion channel family protein [Halopseudomonas sabulinigri]
MDAEQLHFNLEPVMQRLLEEAYRLLAALPMLLLALLVISLCWAAGGWLSRRAVLERFTSRNPFMRDLTRTTVRWSATVIGILIALEIMNATALVGAVLGTAGVLGVALGFAFKNTMENYLAGILMSLRQPFAPKDHVVIDGNEGVVVALTSRATVLMTLDGNHLRVPNALVFSSVMLNYTRNPSRRFSFDVGIGVNEDLVLAQRIGTSKLDSLDGVMDTPPPRAYITALGDSNVQVRYHAWVDQRSHDFISVKSEAIRQVKLALEEAEMDMPEPIYRVQLTERNAVLTPTAGASESPSPKPSLQPSSEPEVDMRVQGDLDAQIAQDQSKRGAEDLLDPSAPRE